MRDGGGLCDEIVGCIFIGEIGKKLWLIIGLIRERFGEAALE